MLSFDNQQKSIDGTVVVVDEYLKFQNTKRTLETIGVSRNGFWNVFKRTVELESFLSNNGIKFHISDFYNK